MSAVRTPGTLAFLAEMSKILKGVYPERSDYEIRTIARHVTGCGLLELYTGDRGLSDAERGRISLSTKALEPEPGDMLTDPAKVFEKAEEMAARYKQMLLEQAEDGEPMEVIVD